MHATAAFPVVGVDLSKHVFELAVADEQWRIVERARLSRSQFERWFANRTVGCVVMESCGSAHHWGRWLAGRGIALATNGAPGLAASMSAHATTSPPQMTVIRQQP